MAMAIFLEHEIILNPFCCKRKSSNVFATKIYTQAKIEIFPNLNIFLFRVKPSTRSYNK